MPQRYLSVIVFVHAGDCVISRTPSVTRTSASAGFLSKFHASGGMTTSAKVAAASIKTEKMCIFMVRPATPHRINFMSPNVAV